jgi:hypothetical protein
VANRARPFAQFRNPVICSAINFDSGTNSVNTPATSKSDGFLLSSPVTVKPQEQCVAEDALDLTPGQPIRRSGQLHQVEVRRVAAILPDLNAPDRLSFILVGQIHKPKLIESSLPQHFGRKLRNVIGRGHHEDRTLLFLQSTKRQT